MVAYDLVRADLGRFGHSDLMVKPRRCNKSLASVLKAARRTVYHVAHAVDHAHGAHSIVAKAYLNSVLGYEFGFGGHDSPARSALRQLVTCALPGVFILNVRNDQGVHKALYKCRFARSHGAYHTYHDCPVGARGNIFVYIGICHRKNLRSFLVCTSL